MKFLAAVFGPPNVSRDFDDAETFLILPFFVHLLLAVRLRRLLRRWLGRRAGTAVGNCVIVIVGGPPCLLGFATLLLIRLSIKLLDVLDLLTNRARRSPRGDASRRAGSDDGQPP